MFRENPPELTSGLLLANWTKEQGCSLWHSPNLRQCAMKHDCRHILELWYKIGDPSFIFLEWCTQAPFDMTPCKIVVPNVNYYVILSSFFWPLNEVVKFLRAGVAQASPKSEKTANTFGDVYRHCFSILTVTGCIRQESDNSGFPWQHRRNLIDLQQLPST